MTRVPIDALVTGIDITPRMSGAVNARVEFRRVVDQADDGRPLYGGRETTLVQSLEELQRIRDQHRLG